MKRFCLVVSVLVLVLSAGCAMAGEKVLLIFSYHPEFAWVVEETRGVEAVFQGKKVIETEKFYMDTKRKTGEAWKKKVAEEAVRKIEEFKPDLVIVFDDNACELVAERYVGTSLPIVFAGMNGDPEDYGFPAENITGVIERHHYWESLEFLKRLVPDVERVALITDDNPTSHAFVARMRKAVLPIGMVELYTTNDFDVWKAKVKELQSRVDAIGLFTYHTIKEKGEQVSLTPGDVLGWTLQHSQLPEFAFFDFSVRGGALCGVTLSGYEQGRAAAEIALMILAGASPANIPIRNPQKGTPIVNEKRAEELNISIPAGDLLNEQYKPVPKRAKRGITSIDEILNP